MSDLGPYEKMTDAQKREFFRNRESGLSLATRLRAIGKVLLSFPGTASYGEELCSLADEEEQRNADTRKVQLQLAEAAREIDVAGPVAHRIRVLRTTLSECIQARDTEIAELRRSLGQEAKNPQR